MWSHDTFPLSCEGQRPIDDNVDLGGAISHRHADFMQAGLQWCLACRETSGNWEREEGEHSSMKLKYNTHTHTYTHIHFSTACILFLQETVSGCVQVQVTYLRQQEGWSLLLLVMSQHPPHEMDTHTLLPSSLLTHNTHRRVINWCVSPSAG